MKRMLSNTGRFVQKMFSEYYKAGFCEVYIPTLFEKREFAALLFRNKIMVRHKSFKTTTELDNFLRADTPSDVYYSSAYYERPDAAEMDSKNWMGADLIFDIDADHIVTPCDRTHDEWTCEKCGFSGKGITPEKCPACRGEKFDECTWLCEVCLESAKSETIKLLDMLTNDFDVKEKSIHVFFSGHRGYHLHVIDETIESLDAVARKEIVDYVTGLGFDPILQRIDGNNLQTLKLDDYGWRGRIAKGIHNVVLTARHQDYIAMGLTKNISGALTKNKEVILKNLESLETLKKIKSLGSETWRRIAEYSLESQSANVDTVVTTDVHRLIRLAGTLHNKTGLKKTEFPVSTINKFDPFTSAVAFKEGEVTIFVSKAPKFRICTKTYGPYTGEEVTLPTAAAMLLLCKNRAEVIQQNV
jgi:DNA primase small subunit